jgi:hypothetical protein
MFERGREFERGRSPLSPELPSPAIDIFGILPVFPAGEGIKGLGYYLTKHIPAEPIN